MGTGHEAAENIYRSEAGMHFPKNDRQAEFMALADRLAERIAERADEHDRENTFPFENFEDLRREGFLALALPVELGGRGLSIYDFCLLQETFARGCGATALGTNMHWYNVGGGLHLFTESFRHRVAEAIVGEGAVVASSLSEPAASLGTPLVSARKVRLRQRAHGAGVAGAMLALLSGRPWGAYGPSVHLARAVRRARQDVLQRQAVRHGQLR